jgi:Cd2+/Zn2+-exporting ATPase
VFSVKEIPGKGVCADIDGRSVLVGNTGLMADFGVTVTECHHHHTGTIVHVAVENCYAGHVEISDTVKPDAERTIRALKPRKTVILTGDRESVGREVASRLQVDEVYCGLLPDEKVTKLEELLEQKPKGSALAFVGDGINDAPVLSRADVGIAMGALGSDAAIEAADVVLMDDKPLGVATAIRCAKKTKRIVWQNVIFSLSVKVGVLAFEIAAAFAAHGHMAHGHNHMGLAAFADVGVLVLAVLNATRALRVPKN